MLIGGYPGRAPPPFDIRLSAAIALPAAIAPPAAMTPPTAIIPGAPGRETCDYEAGPKAGIRESRHSDYDGRTLVVDRLMGDCAYI